jgi:hypothetical protein
MPTKREFTVGQKIAIGVGIAVVASLIIAFIDVGTRGVYNSTVGDIEENSVDIEATRVKFRDHEQWDHLVTGELKQEIKGMRESQVRIEGNITTMSQDIKTILRDGGH